MYNIHSHYENIFLALQPIVTYRRLLYLRPFGATQPENIETITDYYGHISGYVKNSPMFIFYDQEPIYGEYNHRLLDYVQEKFQAPFVLVTTEQNSEPLDTIKQRYNWPTAYYFHHAFAAADWFRGYRYHPLMIDPGKRTLSKKYICFNRLTGGHRVYRTLLVSELAKRNLLDYGHVSYSKICPDGGDYVEHLESSQLDATLIKDTISTVEQLPELRIDFKDQSIPNQSFTLNAIPETQESFVYVVTETCYWDRKDHLTEKVFKPIVSRMPFIVVGPAGSLKYLRSYGFKTFDYWWDESYDTIEDPVERMTAVTNLIQKICGYDLRDLEDLLKEMQSTLDHNYRRFYSNGFLDQCWSELRENLSHAVSCI